MSLGVRCSRRLLPHPLMFFSQPVSVSCIDESIASPAFNYDVLQVDDNVDICRSHSVAHICCCDKPQDVSSIFLLDDLQGASEFRGSNNSHLHSIHVDQPPVCSSHSHSISHVSDRGVPVSICLDSLVPLDAHFRISLGFLGSCQEDTSLACCDVDQYPSPTACWGPRDSSDSAPDLLSQSDVVQLPASVVVHPSVTATLAFKRAPSPGPGCDLSGSDCDDNVGLSQKRVCRPMGFSSGDVGISCGSRDDLVPGPTQCWEEAPFNSYDDPDSQHTPNSNHGAVADDQGSCCSCFGAPKIQRAGSLFDQLTVAREVSQISGDACADLDSAPDGAPAVGGVARLPTHWPRGAAAPSALAGEPAALNPPEGSRCAPGGKVGFPLLIRY